MATGRGGDFRGVCEWVPPQSPTRSPRRWWQWSRGVPLALLPRAPHPGVRPRSRRDAPNAGSGFWIALAGLSPGSSRLWLEELITAVVLSSAKLSLSPGWQTASAVWSPSVGPSPLEHPCRDGTEESQNPQTRSIQCWDFTGCKFGCIQLIFLVCSPNGAGEGSGRVVAVIQQSPASPEPGAPRESPNPAFPGVRGIAASITASLCLLLK